MSSARSTTELSLLAAAATLLEQGGPGAVTTRAVLAEAHVTAPTLYHHFGDKDGLLDALLEDGVARFFAHKAALEETADARRDLAVGWDRFLDFVCEQPQLFRLLAVRAMEEPQLVTSAMAWTRRRLEQLEITGQLGVDASFAAQVLLAVSNGVAMLRAQGASDLDVRRVGQLIFINCLAALTCTQTPY
jgi:AcrR family transcriptional regulator